MANQAAQRHQGGAQSPLERLSEAMAPDMLAVNEMILANMQSDVPLIPRLAGYLIASGGKRIRPLLTLAATALYGGDMNRAHGLAASVEFIHTATLLHDDVVDESAARRGQESANIVFGNQASVLVGDFLFSRAFQLMVADGSLEVLRILSQASATIAEGEVRQLATTGNLETSMQDYLTVIGAKTAALFAAACEIGPVVGGAGTKAQESMRDYGMNLGIAFQIADDVLDYNADQSKLGKTVGDDFREGKMTAPVLIAIENATSAEKKFWTRTIADRKQGEGDLARATEILYSHDAMEKGLARARAFAAKAAIAMDATPAEKGGTIGAALRDLIEFSVDRAY